MPLQVGNARSVGAHPPRRKYIREHVAAESTGSYAGRTHQSGQEQRGSRRCHSALRG